MVWMKIKQLREGKLYLIYIQEKLVFIVTWYT